MTYFTSFSWSLVTLLLCSSVQHLFTTAAYCFQQAVGGRPPRYASAPCKLTVSSYLFARWHLHVLRHVGYLRHQQQVDLLTLKLVSESCVTWATSVSILVFLCLSVLELGIRDRQTSDVRQTDVRQKHRLMPPPYGAGHNNTCHQATARWLRRKRSGLRDNNSTHT